MKRSKFSEEQVAYALRQAESGTPVGDVCRQLGVSEATFYAWKKKYAHLGVSELRRLRQLEERPGRARLPSIMAPSSSRARSKTGLIVVASSSISFGPGNLLKMRSSKRSMGDCAMNV